MNFRTIVGVSLLLTVSAGCGGASNTAPANAQTPAPSASAVTQPAAVQTVTIESPDKTVLVGSLFDSGKANSPGLLLLHQWQSDRHSYDEFAKALQARGFTVLAIDGRRGSSRRIRRATAEAHVHAMVAHVALSATRACRIRRERIG